MKKDEFATTEKSFDEAVVESTAVEVVDATAKQEEKLVTYDEAGNQFIIGLTDTRKTSLCTLRSDTMEEKAVLFNIMNNPEKRLSDMIGEVIEVTDLFVEVISLRNDETGEMVDCPRIVIIDKNKVGYQCVSVGVWSAFKKLISVYGSPTWEVPLKLKVKQIQKGKRSLLTLNVA